MYFSIMFLLRGERRQQIRSMIPRDYSLFAISSQRLVPYLTNFEGDKDLKEELQT